MNHDEGIDVEQALLGSLLLNPRQVYQIREDVLITPNHFFIKEHGYIFDAICCLVVEEGVEAVDAITVKYSLFFSPNRIDEIEVLGQKFLLDQYLAKLLRLAPSVSNAVSYGCIILHLSEVRDQKIKFKEMNLRVN